jgi:hypothetical protein
MENRLVWTLEATAASHTKPTNERQCVTDIRDPGPPSGGDALRLPSNPARVSGSLLVLSDGRSEGVRRLRLFVQGRTQKPLLKSPVPINISSGDSMTGIGAIVIVAVRGTATGAPGVSGASGPAPFCLIKASATAVASERLVSVGAPCAAMPRSTEKSRANPKHRPRTLTPALAMRIVLIELRLSASMSSSFPDIVFALWRNQSSTRLPSIAA